MVVMTAVDLETFFQSSLEHVVDHLCDHYESFMSLMDEPPKRLGRYRIKLPKSMGFMPIEWLIQADCYFKALGDTDYERLEEVPICYRTKSQPIALPNMNVGP